MDINLETPSLNLDTFRQVFEKLSHNDEVLREAVNNIGTQNHVEIFTASEGQTRFKLKSGTYAPTTGVLAVYVDNVPQVVNEGFIELSESEFEVTEPLELGQVVKASYYDICMKPKIVYAPAIN